MPEAVKRELLKPHSMFTEVNLWLHIPRADAFSMTRILTKNILQDFCVVFVLLFVCSRWKCYLGKCKLLSWRCYSCCLDVFFLFESVTSSGMSVPLIRLACSAPSQSLGGKSLIANTDKLMAFQVKVRESLALCCAILINNLNRADHDGHLLLSLLSDWQLYHSVLCPHSSVVKCKCGWLCIPQTPTLIPFSSCWSHTHLT